VTRPSFEFDATVWEHDGAAAWHFVSLPPEEADLIEETHAPRSGFGSIRVSAEIGTTRWSTSIFPDSKRATFVLPVKKAVRAAEGLADGSAVRVKLDVVDA
jgi:hypothetical protein